ncbi:MAG: polymerase subunit alpha [Mucilaginibacter sp.]|nr:polymerase subunit alpha [Mucilaginibacter sp.]
MHQPYKYPTKKPMYINVHSQYSLRYGTLSIKALVAQAREKGIERMVLTDINNSTGCMEFVKECSKNIDSDGVPYKNRVKPIVGIEFRRDNQLLYIGIARNHEGFKELNDFLTKYNLNKLPLPDKPLLLPNIYIIYPYGHNHLQLKENEFIGIRHTQLNKLFGKNLKNVEQKLLVWQPVTLGHDKTAHRLHQYLRAIDLNTLLSKLTPDDYCQPDEVMLTMPELKRRFEQYPFIIENTKKLLNDCNINVELKTSKNRKTFTGDPYRDNKLLNELAYAGYTYRYGSSKLGLEKLKKELDVIKKLKYEAYFLITHDIVHYGMKQGFYHVGRGSGANSLVAFCLKITDVDPLELDLYFERFLNEKRSSQPDFDIDFSWDERRVIEDYIFEKYGPEHTALLGTMSEFKGRSIFREIGKVLGVPKAEIDDFTDPSKDYINEKNPAFKKIRALQEKMNNMPNQRSIHAGGILISEEPITYYTALDLPPKGLPTVQWDMYAAEDIGYEKFDILSQRGIGHIKEAVRLVKENLNIDVDVHAIRKFKNDPVINNKLKNGDTIGAFYVESPAMRGLLKKLECDNYLNLVAASSIIRPGVAQSGMMRSFIERYHDPSKIIYLHPVMEEQLKETYGVMVYQEDVIKVCHHYAGLDLTDADILRRAMSGKYRSKIEFDKLVDKFFRCAKALGRPDDTTLEVWRQVSSFAGYSFSKAHSASFAVESYQSLFLKTYYPREFMVAVLNNYGGFYSRWLYVHELRKAGAVINLPCVNNSEATVCIKGAHAYLGFIGILNLENRFINLIAEERRLNGDYLDLENFVKRTGITLEQTITLIRLGAFRFTGKNKKELLWEVYNYLGNKPAVKVTKELFNVPGKHYQLPELVQDKFEDAFDEIELLSYPVTCNMFDLLKTSYRGDVMAKDMINHLGKTVKMVGSFVCDKSVHTIKGTNMYFGTFIDHAGDFFDTTHFPGTFTYNPFKGKGCYLILGKVVEEFGFCSIEVTKFAKLDIVNMKEREMA